MNLFLVKKQLVIGGDRYTFTLNSPDFSKYFKKQQHPFILEVFHHSWKNGGAFITPNGMNVKQYLSLSGAKKTQVFLGLVHLLLFGDSLVCNSEL